MKTISKLLILVIAIPLLSQSFMTYDDQDNGSFKVEGKTIIAQKASSTASNDILTDYSYEDAKGETYPIYLHKYTKGENAGSYTTYIIKTSKKTGKTYKYYIPNGKEIAQEIINNSKNL